MVIDLASEVIYGLLLRAILQGVTEHYKVKLASPNPLFGLATVIWYAMSPRPDALSAWIVFGFVCVDFLSFFKSKKKRKAK